MVGLHLLLQLTGPQVCPDHLIKLCQLRNRPNLPAQHHAGTLNVSVNQEQCQPQQAAVSKDQQIGHTAPKLSIKP